MLPPHAFRLLCIFLPALACGHSKAAQSSSRQLVAQPEKAPEASAAPATEQQAAASAAPSDGADVRTVMEDHFMLTKVARDAVIAGDLAAVRDPLHVLADYAYPSELPESWRGSLLQLRETARKTAEATSLDAAAKGVAAMARVCGDCHLKNTGDAELGASSEPLAARSEALQERMERHVLALDRMWIGLTGPSEDAWRDGAAVLAHAPARVDAATPEVRAALLELRTLGTRATQAKSTHARAEVYARMLSKCARCHALHAEIEF